MAKFRSPMWHWKLPKWHDMLLRWLLFLFFLWSDGGDLVPVDEFEFLDFSLVFKWVGGRAMWLRWD